MKKNNSRNAPNQLRPVSVTLISKHEFILRPAHFINRTRKGEVFVFLTAEGRLTPIVSNLK
jgi:hypothetical protein